MIRNLKALSLALAAVFAMSAVAAAGAQASDHLQCGVANPATETCTIKVTQDEQAPSQNFKVPGAGTVKCQEFHAHYMGPATLSSSSTLNEVKYEKCTFLGLAATVNFEGVAGNPCDYTLEAPLTTVEGHGQGGVSIGPKGCQVKITIPGEGCTLTVEGKQEFPGAITYTEAETAGIKHITAHATTGETIKVTGKGELCEGLSSEKGSYTGTFTASAFTTSGTAVPLTLVST